MISIVINISVGVMSLSRRLTLITPTSTLIILDITKTSSKNCLLNIFVKKFEYFPNQGANDSLMDCTLRILTSKLGSLDELARNKMKMSARKWRSLSDWVNNQSRGSYISDTCLSIFADSTIINSQKMIKYFSETNDVIPLVVLDALRILHNFEFFPLRWREKEIFFLVRSLYKFWQFT